MRITLPQSWYKSGFTEGTDTIFALLSVVFSLVALPMTFFSAFGLLSLIPLVLLWGGTLIRPPHLEENSRLILMMAGAELLIFIAALWYLPVSVILQLFVGVLMVPVPTIQQLIAERDPAIIGMSCATVILVSISAVVSTFVLVWPMILFSVALGAGMILAILLYDQIIRSRYLPKN